MPARNKTKAQKAMTTAAKLTAERQKKTRKRQTTSAGGTWISRVGGMRRVETEGHLRSTRAKNKQARDAKRAKKGK